MNSHLPAGDAGRSEPGVDLSVVIACFNGQETLPTQLDALAAQDDPVPFEVILADNGSTDDSAAIARSYAHRIDIRVVDASGVKGPGHARNVGVAAARSDRIAFCDADDEVAATWVCAAYRALDAHDFVAGKVDIEKLNSASTRRTRVMAQQEGLQDSAVGVGFKHAGAGNMAFRRAAFETVDGFDETLRCLQDSDLCWRMQMAGTRLVYMPDLIIYTRLRSTLGSMARQGYLYGKSFAQLESRYGVNPQAGGQATSEAGRDCGGPSLRDRLSRVARFGRLARRGLGGTVWQLAWHAGHRSGRRAVRRRPVHIKDATPA
ncbi:MAG: glycosyltransferase [Micrococcales bacterium]|nr:glycosyltransferase [Micrococcales bacterium]